MALDHVPKHAGVYQLTFKLWGNSYTYIGEAGARGLRARIGDHANHPPAEGNKAEHLLHDLLFFLKFSLNPIRIRSTEILRGCAIICARLYGFSNKPVTRCAISNC
jgi:hypothetical protein